jgi:hypothetical protein
MKTDKVVCSRLIPEETALAFFGVPLSAAGRLFFLNRKWQRDSEVAISQIHPLFQSGQKYVFAP